jgi:uncharacterized protein (TIGR02001 family)
MNKAHRWSLVLLPCLALGAGAARAQEPGTADPVAQWSANAGVVTQYVSRGIRQTWGRPAVQAGADYAHPSGWSAGTWASTVSGRFLERGRVEWDLYGGYTGSAGPVGYSVMAYVYRYPGAVMSATGTKFDYAEVALGATWRAASVKYYRTVSSMFFGIPGSRGTGYLDLGLNPDLGDGWTLNLHAGDGRVAGAGNDMWNWRDAKAGVTKNLGGGWSASLAATRAWGRTGVYKTYTTGVPDAAGTLHSADVARATLVLGVTRTF